MSLVRIFALTIFTAIVACPGIAQDATRGDSAAVAARRIARGTVLTVADIRGEQALTGWVARRVIQPGEPLQPPAVAPAPIVRMRQQVSVLVSSHPVTLTMAGISLGEGSLGDTILVRLDARRRLPGVISGPGRVTASLPLTR
jgi:flagella basal body P-ring formation protein FlgA